MTEKEELAKLKKRRKQIETKYAKKAKKRLSEIDRIISPNTKIVDMSEKEFENLLTILRAEVDFYNNHYAEYQRARQQRQNQNYNQQNNQR